MVDSVIKGLKNKGVGSIHKNVVEMMGREGRKDGRGADREIEETWELEI